MVLCVTMTMGFVILPLADLPGHLADQFVIGSSTSGAVGSYDTVMLDI